MVLPVTSLLSVSIAESVIELSFNLSSISIDSISTSDIQNSNSIDNMVVHNLFWISFLQYNRIHSCMNNHSNWYHAMHSMLCTDWDVHCFVHGLYTESAYQKNILFLLEQLLIRPTEIWNVKQKRYMYTHVTKNILQPWNYNSHWPDSPTQKERRNLISTACISELYCWNVLCLALAVHGVQLNQHYQTNAWL